MLKFIQITDFDDGDFNSAMDIYSNAFPRGERHPESVIRERVRKGLNEIYIGRIESDIVFMALLWPLKSTDFILLDYMATNPQYRGKNIGSSFLKEMHDILIKKKKYFIMEVENPDYGENRIERQRRVDFYRRNGAKQLRDVRYILPPLQGSEPTEMILMIFPNYNSGKIDTTMVKSLIIQIYKELYNRESDSLISSSIEDKKSHIELI